MVDSRKTRPTIFPKRKGKKRKAKLFTPSEALRDECDANHALKLGLGNPVFYVPQS